MMNEFLRRKLCSEYARLKLLELLGEKCSECGCGGWRGLHIDHILSIDGRRDRKEGRAHYSCLNHPDEALKKLQVLCATQHTIKHSTWPNISLEEALKVASEQEIKMKEREQKKAELQTDRLNGLNRLGWPDYKPPEIDITKIWNFNSQRNSI